MQSEVANLFGNIQQKFQQWDTVAVPDEDGPEWWAGGPSVARGDDGTFWMAARMRTPDAPLGLRGYEVRIYRSDDGITFERAHSIKREDVPIKGFERPSLLRDPETGAFKLYGCGPLEDGWSIVKWDDVESPDQFAAATAKTVIAPLPDSRDNRRPVGVYERGPMTPVGYKDPVIVHIEGQYHCFVIGHLQAERVFHFVSDDGESWEPVGGRSQAIMNLAGWHTYAVRPASIVPVGAGYLFVYEGSSTTWPDASYNIRTGLGFTFDLHHITDLTPDEPLLVSPTPGRLPVWRYSHWMWVDDQLWAYAEVEKENGAHEIRLFRLNR